METYKVKLPWSDEISQQWRAGDKVLLSGTIYTARDAAHSRLIALLSANEALPFELQGAVIYYAGPSPAAPSKAVGAIGPTTSGRMDTYTIPLLQAGMAGCIGKGERSDEVKKAMLQHGAIYLVAIGGAAAMLSKQVIEMEMIAYPELGPEAIYKLKVKDFPCYVALDKLGNSLYDQRKRNA